MKKVLSIIMVIAYVSAWGNTNDSLKIVSLQREVSDLKTAVSRLQQEEGSLRDLYHQHAKILDSLQVQQQQQVENVRFLADELGTDISNANQKIDSNVNTLSESINNRTWLGALGILIAIGILACAYYVLRKKISRGTTTIDMIRSAQEEFETAQKAMQEESVKLDNKLVELLDKKIEATPTSNATEQTDHALALKVADEIVRIETNMSRMDTTIKGYKQLAKAVERIRMNFLANGYEIVEMLGKPYNEGMKVIANFVSDDTLAEGEQKITGIIKPQINYKGKMIQSAQITVSQNL
ncbi:MAG: hypothetical protein J6U08_00360 [Paludibacteraceae bacterium]|nr:hypothetical protein [Paludibacteraceae bacterium]